MARIGKTALTLLLFILSNSSSATTLIDGKGSLLRSNISNSGSTSASTIAVVNSSDDDGESSSTEVTLSTSGQTNILTTSGATLTSPRSKANPAAAAAAVSNSIVLTGITEADLECGLDDTRHGHTLTALFRGKLLLIGGDGDESSKTSLFLSVPSSDDVGEKKVLKDVEAIFDSVVLESGDDATTSLSLKDLYDVHIVSLDSGADLSKVMEMASEAASNSPTKGNISDIANAYTKISQSTATTISATTTSSSEPPPSVAAAILACDMAFAKHTRTARAKLTSWKSRTVRGLTVDNFGTASTQLLKRTMELYDRDTISAAGLTATAAPYRLELRSKLRARVEGAIRDLFLVQVEILEKSTLKKFNAVLLRKHSVGGFDGSADTERFYNDNAAAVRTAAFAFENAMSDLEVPSLSLTKDKATREVSAKLNTDLLSFPDSPAARLKGLKEVERVVSKQKKPSERSIDLGLDLVAMVRPDGFGNFQGFAGYQLGGNNVIVGVHNDADMPDVISQFGGIRPPFIRVQPKLKVDVEL